MKVHVLILALVAGLIIFGAGPAGAVLINFDNLAPGNIDGLNIGPGSPDGVVITSSDGSASVYLGDQSGFGFTSWPNTVSNFGYITSATLTITFEVPRGFVAFVGGDSGGDTDQFTVAAYDAGGNLITSFTTPVFGGNPIDPNNIMVDQYQVAFNGSDFIKKVVVSNAINAGILIDDLQYCHPVPVPPALLLLGSGLLGLVGLRRKFKR